MPNPFQRRTRPLDDGWIVRQGAREDDGRIHRSIAICRYCGTTVWLVGYSRINHRRVCTKNAPLPKED